MTGRGCGWMARVVVCTREDPHLNLPPQTGEEVGGEDAAARVLVGARVRGGPRQAATRERPYGSCGRTPVRGGGRPQGSAPTGPAGGRPYGGEGGHKGTPLRWGGRPQGSAPTDGEGGHKGAPVRGGGRPQGSATTVGRAATRERPYGGEGGHKGAPVRVLREDARTGGRAATRERPYGGDAFTIYATTQNPRLSAGRVL